MRTPTLGTGDILASIKYVLFGMGSYMAILSANKAYLDALSSVTKLVTQVGNHTQMRQMYVYSLRGVMEICRYSTPPNANAFIDCIYHVIIQPSTPLTRSYPLLYPTNSLRRSAAVTHFST